MAAPPLTFLYLSNELLATFICVYNLYKLVVQFVQINIEIGTNTFNKLGKYILIQLQSGAINIHVQGAPKKMHHSDLYPISVLEVGFNFFACVL